MTIYQGLKIIAKTGLPHPEWEFVRSSKDLKNFYKVKDYVGWTIRTVNVKNAKWKNLYVNWLAKSKVPAKVDELQKKQRGKAMFVVYPSWKWKVGGTILLEPNREVIEGVRGGVVDLMRYGKVDASITYKNKKIVAKTGNQNLFADNKRQILLARKIRRSNIILEWGITTQNKFIFYRIEDIKEAGKLLLEKYL